MADNTILNPGVAGDTIRDIDRGGNGVKTQVVQLDIGGVAANAEKLVTGGASTSANSVPVAVASDNIVQTADINVAEAQTSDGSIGVFVTGDPSGQFANINILESLVDDAGEFNLNVNVRTPVNVGSIAGTQIGTPGTLPVGGNVASGVRATTNPVPIAGVDASSITRRILTDANGRVQVNATEGATTATGALAALGANPVTWQGTTALNVQETTQNDGAGLVELLALLLTELRISNQLLAELPNKLVSGLTTSQFVPGDDPNDYRNDPSFQFNSRTNILGN